MAKLIKLLLKPKIPLFEVYNIKVVKTKILHRESQYAENSPLNDHKKAKFLKLDQRSACLGINVGFLDIYDIA